MLLQKLQKRFLYRKRAAMNNTTAEITVRPATEDDVPFIHALLEPYADKGIVLRRSREDILFYIRNFRTAWINGEICGCVAVRDFGNKLMEVRSLVVGKKFQGTGVGRKLIEFVLEQLGSMYPEKDWNLFTLTGQAVFFQRLGFKVVNKEMFPEKIWSDCSKCKKQHCCDEVALLYDHNA